MNVRATMKKRILPALLLACLLAIACCACAVGEECRHNIDWNDWHYSETEHWYVCKDCGEEVYRETHWISCTAETGICVDCGRAGTGKIAHNWDAWQYNETKHWRACKDCGEIEEPWEHWIRCATGRCIYCDQAGTNEIYHQWILNNLKYSETEHWYTCKDCGGELREKHCFFCTEDLCMDCGRAGAGERIHVAGPDDVKSNQTEHWVIFEECGEEIYRDEHWISCQTGLCVQCDRAGTGQAYHDVNKLSEIKYNATECWYICLECGQEAYRGPHGISCSTGLCVYCGQKGTGKVIHSYDADEYQFDEKEHWFVCFDCQEKAERATHEWKNGRCVVCGKRGAPSERVSGDANGDGKITTADVLQLLKYVSGWGVEVNAANSDVTGDGKITTADVLLLLKYVSGWGVTLQ